MTADAGRFDVCVVGSANHDLILDVECIPAPGETVLAQDRSSGPGGKGLNQAVAAARAGAAAAFVGSVGPDEAGSLLRASLADAGVDVGSLRTVAGPTGSAVVLRAQDGENAIVVAAGANGAEFEWDDAVRLRVRSSAVVLCQQEVPAALNEAVVSCAAAGAVIVLNAAPAIPVASALLDGVHVLVVNEHELAAQLATAGPGAADGLIAAETCDAAQTFDAAETFDAADGLAVAALIRSVAAQAAGLATTSRAVVVTLGAAGAVCVEAAGATHVPPAAADRVVDTTGAGDAFCGALCAALARGQALVDAVRSGCAAGTLAVGVAGAAPSMPGADEIAAAVAGADPPRALVHTASVATIPGPSAAVAQAGDDEPVG